MNPPIAVDEAGNELLSFHPGAEAGLEHLDFTIPLPLSLVVARHSGATLLVFDRRRQEWELPGGMIEAGETPRQAAIREFEEETGHPAPPLDYVGVVLFRLLPDSRLEHAAVFSGLISERRPFAPNDEIERLTWWDGRRDPPGLSVLDAAVARLSGLGE